MSKGSGHEKGLDGNVYILLKKHKRKKKKKEKKKKKPKNTCSIDQSLDVANMLNIEQYNKNYIF